MIKFLGAALILLAPMPQASLAQDEALEKQAAEAFLWPSFAVGAHLKDLANNRGTRPRQEITAPYLNAVRKDNLSENERFSLGQLLFNSLQADPVVDIMKDYMDGDDWVTRHAYLIMMQTEFVALGNSDVVVNEYYPEFIRRFGVSSSHDIIGLSDAVRNIAWLQNDNGDQDKAIALIEREIRRIGFKAPYVSFYLPFWHKDIFQNAGRTADAVGLMEFAKAGLEEELAARLERGPTAEEEVGPMMPMPMRRWYWAVQRLVDDPSVFEGRNRQFREMIEALERGIAAAQESMDE